MPGLGCSSRSSHRREFQVWSAVYALPNVEFALSVQQPLPLTRNIKDSLPCRTDGISPNTASADVCRLFPMPRFLIFLEYLGSDFSGAQRISQTPSVQSTLEAALETIAGTPVRSWVSSRTDAGVHSLGNAFHADISRSNTTVGILTYAKAPCRFLITLLASGVHSVGNKEGADTSIP